MSLNGIPSLVARSYEIPCMCVVGMFVKPSGYLIKCCMFSPSNTNLSNDWINAHAIETILEFSYLEFIVYDQYSLDVPHFPPGTRSGNPVVSVSKTKTFFPSRKPITDVFPACISIINLF